MPRENVWLKEKSGADVVPLKPKNKNGADRVAKIEACLCICVNSACDKKHNKPYGLVSRGIASCCKDCNLLWEALSWAEKKVRLNTIKLDRRYEGPISE